MPWFTRAATNWSCKVHILSKWAIIILLTLPPSALSAALQLYLSMLQYPVPPTRHIEASNDLQWFYILHLWIIAIERIQKNSGAERKWLGCVNLQPSQRSFRGLIVSLYALFSVCRSSWHNLGESLAQQLSSFSSSHASLTSFPAFLGKVGFLSEDSESGSKRLHISL